MAGVPPSATPFCGGYPALRNRNGRRFPLVHHVTAAVYVDGGRDRRPKTGAYAIAYGVPGHAGAGMWDVFKVTTGGHASLTITA